MRYNKSLQVTFDPLPQKHASPQMDLSSGGKGINMKWTLPENGKKKVRKAGDALIEEWTDLDKVLDSFGVLSNWRSAHAYPMHSMLMLLRDKAVKIDKQATVVQRLKRTPSILAKLRREHGMKLDRMEDIGGCRAVLSNTSQAQRLSNALKSSRTTHHLHRERNYIDNPKPSGYRGIHLVYKYGGSKPEYKNMAIELQVRSLIQHSWATAVEVVDAFTKQALKASQGDDDWLAFFRAASAELAKLEKCPIDPKFAGVDTGHVVQELMEKLNVVNRLKTFAVSTKHLGEDHKNKSDYFILILDFQDAVIKVKRFSMSRFDEATEEYAELEKQLRKNDNKDVVLVAASSIHGLKKAYPNYFADTSAFVKNLEKALKTNKVIHETSA